MCYFSRFYFYPPFSFSVNFALFIYQPSVKLISVLPFNYFVYSGDILILLIDITMILAIPLLLKQNLMLLESRIMIMATSINLVITCLW